MEEVSFQISLFNNKNSTRPRVVSHSWQSVCNKLASPIVRTEKDGPLFSPARFEPSRRANENVIELCALVLDCDHKATFAGIVKILEPLAILFFIYTSHSHLRQTASNPNAEERLRIFIPLASPIPAKHFPTLWEWAFRLLEGNIDPQTKALAQMFYMPAIADKDAPYQYHIGDGQVLDWKELIPRLEPEPIETAPLEEISLNETKEAADSFSDNEKQAILLIAGHWKVNHRHNTSMALSSVLLRADWSQQRVEDFIRLIALTASDDEVEDRVKCVATTLKRIQSNGKCTGYPKLKELLGEEVFSSLSELLHLQPLKHSTDDQPIESSHSIDDALEPLRSLTEESSPCEIEVALRLFSSRSTALDLLGRQVAREGAIRLLKEIRISSPARLVDAVLPKRINEGEQDSRGLILRTPELWPDEVDGAHLLDELTQMLARFVSALEGLLETVALWILYSYAFDAFDLAPILAITSPEKRCGKSTLLMLLEALVSKPLAVSHITPAALFRTIEKYGPTLLIDEADTFMTRNEDLRGIINSGHTRQAAFVIRTVGEDHDPQRFTTWAPKVIAMIGSLPDTIQDRSIIIKMQRKLKTDKKERLRRDRMGEFNALCRRAARWATDHFDELRASDAEVPEAISSDRESDNWRVLLTIADACGNDWAKRAREIACQFAGSEPVTESPRTLLLQDLKLIFEEKGERVTSEEIIKSLVELENRSWAEWKAGKPITKQGLARLLKPLEIVPQKWRDEDDSCRGYWLDQFTDVFSRYLPSTQSPQPPHALESTDCNDLQSPQEPISVATTNKGNLNKINDVATVATAIGGVEEYNSRKRQVHWKLEGKQVIGEAKTGVCEGGCGNWIPFYFLNGTGLGYCQICHIDQSIESQFTE